MSNKKPKTKNSLEIPKRTPGKIQTDYLKNLRPFPAQSHPVEDILGLDNSTGNLGAQNIDSKTPKSEIVGRPNNTDVDAQTEILDVKTPKTKIWTPKKRDDLDAKTPKNKNNKNLDAQISEKTGRWTKYETNRSTDRVSLRPDAKILHDFKVFCAKRKLGMTEFFEIAGLKFIDLDAQNSENLGVLTPFDDRRMMITWKTTSTIINLYLRYNLIFNPNTKWKPRDDEAGFAYNDVDIRIVELGIIQAQTNKFASDPGGTINSFKFYVNEISNFERLGMEDNILTIMLEVNRKRWREITGKSVDLSFLEEK